MATLNHGINVTQIPTAIAAPSLAASGIAFAVGTAPAQAGNGKANEIVMANSYAEAVAALGYSDDWEKYSLCEVMYTHFKLYGTAPVFFVNVLDPAKNNNPFAGGSYPLANGVAEIPFDATAINVQDGDGGAEYAAGVDYDISYTADKCLIARRVGGAIPESATEIFVKYSLVTPSTVTEDDIIGGYAVATGKSTGLELLNQVYGQFGIVPDVVIAPGWSHRSAVAAAMSAAVSSINSVFKGRCIIDADIGATATYDAVPAWKSAKNITDDRQILCWPKLALGGRTFHMSTHAAALMGATDTENGGIPYVSPSNKGLRADGLTAGAAGVGLTLEQADFLNSNGIVTGLSFAGSLRLRGNYTAAYPSNNDVKDYFIPCARMCDWLGNTQILTFWGNLDQPMTRRYADGITDTLNIFMNGLAASGALYDGETSYIAEENPLTNQIQGIIKFRTRFASPVPAKRIDFENEYDVDYITAALS